MTRWGPAEEGPVTVAIEGLEPATTYHFRLFARNWASCGSGEDLEFTTAAAPDPEPEPEPEAPKTEPVGAAAVIVAAPPVFGGFVAPPPRRLLLDAMA